METLNKFLSLLFCWMSLCYSLCTDTVKNLQSYGVIFIRVLQEIWAK